MIDQWATVHEIEERAQEMAGRIEDLEAEVERLRTALHEISDERRTDTVWMKQRARAALTKEEA